MMSLESVEKALRDNDAVKNHNRVLAKNETLMAKIARLEQEARDREERHLNQVRALEEKNSELSSFRIRYKKNNYTPQAFSRLVSSEIEKEHLERIKQGVEARWTAESPRLVREALAREVAGYPSKCSPETKSAIESQGSKQADTILRSRDAWPIWFQKLYQDEVNLGVKKGLDKAFYDTVNQKATEEINRRVNYEWPKFLLEKVTPRLQGTLTDLLKRLNQTIPIRCDKCGSAYNIDIGPDLMASLIKEPYVSLKCPNPSCRDLVILPHSFPLTLGHVVYYITSLDSKDTSNATII